MNLYVANIGYHMQDNDLRKLFESFGNVSSAKVIVDRESSRSRGFGFVTMGSIDEANFAITSLNHKEINGRALSVTLARERKKRGGLNLW